MVVLKSSIVRPLMVILLGLLVVSVGCSRKPKPSTQVTQEGKPPVEEPVKQTEEPTRPTEAQLTQADLKDVFFDYDKYNLRDDARKALEGDARALMQNPSARLVLEGHCDERGTVEYNLALGDRRAQSVQSFLVEFGIDAGRISTISYGEERPFEQGHDESAWWQNRRVHFVLQK